MLFIVLWNKELNWIESSSQLDLPKLYSQLLGEKQRVNQWVNPNWLIIDNTSKKKDLLVYM